MKVAVQNTFIIDVNLKKAGLAGEPIITQNDAVTFVLRVKDGAQSFSLADITRATLVSRRNDNLTVIKDGVINADEITFDIGTTEMEKVGRVYATAQLYGVNGRVSSAQFSYSVTKDPAGSDYVPSTNEQTLIETVLSEGPAIIEGARLLEQRQTDLETSVHQQLAEKEVQILELETQLVDMTQNVKAIVVLTQVEYDLLGVEKDTNNTLYLIRG